MTRLARGMTTSGVRGSTQCVAGARGSRSEQTVGRWRHNPLYRSVRVPLLDLTTTIGMLGFDRRARREAVGLLGLKPGDRVFDVACGTGPSLPLLARVVGESGVVVGIDQSAALIERAKRRMSGVGNVELISSDWLEMNVTASADAAICVLGLSVIDPWEVALERMLSIVRPGGRIAVVDWLLDRSQARLLNVYIRLGSWLAQADPKREILAATEVRLTQTTSYRLPMGLSVMAGTCA
jgi:SAM-dependent methyltransferase